MTQPGEHRATARVILRNPSGEVFLLLTHFDPEVALPPRWITPGGGIEPGESTLDAAVRELYEETGLHVMSSQLGEPVVEFSGKWSWGDGINSHTFHDTFYQLVVDNFELKNENWTADETRDVLEYRWWTIEELANTDELIGPPQLPLFISHR